MCIYCRCVEIVFLLKIHIVQKFFCMPVDGPQLAWERSALIPLSIRYHPRATRHRLKDARFFLPRASFCTIRGVWITRSSNRYPHPIPPPYGGFDTTRPLRGSHRYSGYRPITRAHLSTVPIGQLDRQLSRSGYLLGFATR